MNMLSATLALAVVAIHALATQGELLPGPGECGAMSSVRGTGGQEVGDATEAAVGQFPWVALLQQESGGYCTGALVSKRYVFTTAACAQKRPTKVSLGVHDVGSSQNCFTDPRDGQRVCSDVLELRVEEITSHGEYTPGRNNDIALVRLARDVEFNDFIKPICLPTSLAHKWTSYTGARAYVSGWRVTERAGNDKKLKLTRTVVNTADWPGVEADGHVLATCDTCRDSCGGGTGTPLMVYEEVDPRVQPVWTLIGLTSTNYPECSRSNRFPVLFTRVSHFVELLKRHMRD